MANEINLNLFHIDDIKYGIKENLATVLTEQQVKDQFQEIFVDECYKKGLIKKDMTIVDIGGNMGLTCLYFKDWAKQIYAIEPSQGHFASLSYNTKDLPNVKVFNMGIGAENGRDFIYTNSDGAVPESIYGNGEVKEEFLVMTIEDFMKQENIEHIDLLKIDCEGNEYEILASEAFYRVADKIDNIIGESHFLGGFDPNFIPIILESYGYECKFLPVKNIFRTIANKEGREWRKEYETLFFAERKK